MTELDIAPDLTSRCLDGCDIYGASNVVLDSDLYYKIVANRNVVDICRFDLLSIHLSTFKAQWPNLSSAGKALHRLAPTHLQLCSVTYPSHTGFSQVSLGPRLLSHLTAFG